MTDDARQDNVPHLDANRAAWDEMAAVHAAGAYDVEGFLAGRTGTKPNVPDDLGDVTGKRMLHLQCHFGMDTLMWARQGARVTGVDFSPVAIQEAHKLRDAAGLEARFVQSDVLKLPDSLQGQFDIVITYYGVLPWLPDLKRWGQVIAHYLAPGGFLYVADTHPVAALYEVWEGDPGPSLHYDYFQGGRAQRFESSGGTYADPSAKTEFRETFEWQHTLQDVFGAVIGAGLRVEYLHEFPYTFYNMHYYQQGPPLMHQDTHGWWWMRENSHRLPLMFSLRAALESSL
jgi:SAM-dependent methyltransferase